MPVIVYCLALVLFGVAAMIAFFFMQISAASDRLYRFVGVALAGACAGAGFAIIADLISDSVLVMIGSLCLGVVVMGVLMSLPAMILYVRRLGTRRYR